MAVPDVFRLRLLLLVTGIPAWHTLRLQKCHPQLALLGALEREAIRAIPEVNDETLARPDNRHDVSCLDMTYGTERDGIAERKRCAAR